MVELAVFSFDRAASRCKLVVCCGVGDLFSAEVGFESGDVELPEPAAFGEGFGAECADESDGSACAVDDFLGGPAGEGEAGDDPCSVCWAVVGESAWPFRCGEDGGDELWVGFPSWGGRAVVVSGVFAGDQFSGHVWEGMSNPRRILLCAVFHGRLMRC